MIRARAIGVLASLGLAAGVAHARDAKVTAITPTTIYVDVGTADGVMVGLNLTLVLDGSSVSLRVAAAASHTARLEVVSGMRPAVGAVIPLPANLEGPRPKAPRPGPRALPPWPGAPTRALQVVQAAARHEQPAVASEEPTRVGGELALTMFLTGDAGRTSTSWQDVGVSSQLEIEAGSWRYDHLIDAHLAGSPEVLIAPLQHARARFDVYLMRLAYAPAGVRYQASLGRQPGAPLAELGLVDGGRAQLVVGPSLDVTAFAGVRPADDLGLSLSPRGGVDLGWHRAAGRGRARADLGIAVDAHAGALDRAQAAGSASVATATSFVRADGVVDLAADATGAGGARVTRASGLAIAMWFFFVLIFDLLVLGVLVVTAGQWGGEALPYALLFNPADVFRILNIFSMDDVRTLYGLSTVFPPALAQPWLLGLVMAAWIVGPLAIAAWRFRR